MANIIAVASEKGGVAKTTTVLSVGAALVENALRVLLVDLDAQGDLTLAVGMEPTQVQRSVSSLMLDSTPAATIIRETGLPGLDIIPANADLLLAERFLPIQHNHEYLLRKSLRQGADLKYDYILLDCPPSLGAVTTNALTAADLLIIPTQAEFFSIHALRNMLSLVRRIRQRTNPALRYRLLTTMIDRRNRIHRSLCEQLRTTFGSGVLESRIEVDTKVRESAIAGLPILKYAPKCRAANQYRALAQEVNQYVQEKAQQPA